MSFLFGGKKEKGGELVAIFDIASGSVGYALARIGGRGGKAGNFSIEAAGRAEMFFASEPETGRFSAGMLKALEEAAGALSKSSPKIPRRIFCVLSSPWHISQARVISYKKDKPFVFHDFVLEEIVKGEEENFLKSAAFAPGERGKIIENKTVKVRLNGYESLTPYGEEAREAEISCYFSAASEDILSKITDILEKRLGFTPIEFHSFSMAVFSVIRDVHGHSGSFLTVNVGEEVSEVYFVKENILLESVSFPVGRNDFLRGLSLAGHISSAISLARLAVEGAVTSEETESFARATSSVKESWLGYFRKALIAMASEFYLPETVFLITDKSVLSSVAEAIREEKFSQITFTESLFNILHVVPESFERFYPVKISPEGGRIDSPLVIGAIFAQKLSEIR